MKRPCWCPIHHRYEQLCQCFPHSTLGIPFEHTPPLEEEKDIKPIISKERWQALSKPPRIIIKSVEL